MEYQHVQPAVEGNENAEPKGMALRQASGIPRFRKPGQDKRATRAALQPLTGVYVDKESNIAQKQQVVGQPKDVAAQQWQSGVGQRIAQTRSRSAKMMLEDKPAMDEEVKDVDATNPEQDIVTIVDIDAEDKGNELLMTTYVKQYFTYYRGIEQKYRVQANYMQGQKDITARMRAILNDWLVDVHHKFKLMPETLYLCCNLIDRYLGKFQVSRKNLQLVGCVAMLIASKYEEIYAPEIQDFIYISDRAYTRSQILAMEVHMLNALNYEFTVPTCFMFVNRYLKAVNRFNHRPTKFFTFYLVELGLIDYNFIKYAYSLLSTAAIFVAMLRLRLTTTYPPELLHYSGYTVHDVLEPAKDLVRAHTAAVEKQNKLRAVTKKYSRKDYEEVALHNNSPLEEEVLLAVASGRPAFADVEFVA